MKFGVDLQAAHVRFGAGARNLVAEECDRLGAKRILFVCSPSGAARYAAVSAALGPRCVATFAEAASHAPEPVVERCRALWRSAGADGVVTVGGGSTIALGKILTAEEGARFVCLPTTYSGSEMTSLHGVTEEGQKRTGRDSRVKPDVVVHDPALSRELPLRTTVTSLINALAHPIAALVTDSLSDEEQSDASGQSPRRQALDAITAIYRALEQLAEFPDHREARRWALEGAALAGVALDRGKLGIHHRLAHLIGGRFQAEHSTVHTVLLPHFVRGLWQDDRPLYDQLAQAAGCRDLPAGLHDLAVRAGVDMSLRQLGIDSAEISAAVADGDGLSVPWLWDAFSGRRPSIDTRRLDLGLERSVSLRGPELGPKPGSAQRVIIAVHGRGSNADRAVTLAREITGDRPDITVIAPQAPRLADNSWYRAGYNATLAEHGRDPDHALDHALDTLGRLVDHVLETVAAENVVLFGFSQGACLAAELVARRGLRLGGLIALSGARIGSPDDWTIPQTTANQSRKSVPLTDMPVLLGVSRDDRWVAAADVERTAAYFTAVGAQVTTCLENGDSHQLSALQRIRARDIALGRPASQGQSGFGNAHDSEDLPQALPRVQNSPRRVAYGLYAEQINGTGFAARRHENLRAWLYRVRPAAQHTKFEKLAHPTFRSDFTDTPPEPNLIGYRALDIPDAPTDFIDGMATFGGAGSPTLRRGFAVHVYVANRSMEHRSFYNTDGDLLLVPEHGALTVLTELGALELGPGKIAIVPRGIKFSVLLHGETARGYVAEVFGRHFELPERGPVGANGLTDERHFLAPDAWHEDRLDPAYRITAKFAGELFDARQDFSPYDVVAWHGNYTPYVYDLMAFSPVMNARFDHPDPSIYSVLSAPLDEQGSSTLDFVFFPPRWDATEHTFRPPFFHRNATTEINGIIADPSLKSDGPFERGGYFVTPSMTAHGVLNRGVEHAFALDDAEADQPERIPDGSMWFQFETALPISLTPWARTSDNRIADWHQVWGHYRSHFTPFEK